MLRTFSVAVVKLAVSLAPTVSGVLQGSILGPIRFNLNMLPLRNIIKKHNISFHLYAAEKVLYLPLKSSDSI